MARFQDLLKLAFFPISYFSDFLSFTTSLKTIQNKMEKLGVFQKIQKICNKMTTWIFKID